ncbi:hypothetical protein ACU4GG_17335 [Streptomyces nojiriensis]
MADFTPEQMRRLHDFAEQLAELAEHHEDQWRVQTTEGQIFLTMMSPTAPTGSTWCGCVGRSRPRPQRSWPSTTRTWAIPKPA